MIRHGEPPYLECSSRGDRRFSAFYAKVGNRTIEERYQAFKIFEGGKTGLSIKEAKGRRALNAEDAASYYSHLWDNYIYVLNPHLKSILTEATGFSDVFGQEGSVCQATELWRIRGELLNG